MNGFLCKIIPSIPNISKFNFSIKKINYNFVRDKKTILQSDKNNEKMAKVIGAIVVDTEHCKGCGLCVEACKFDVLALSHKVNLKGYNYAEMKNPANCTGCTNCATVCPDTVITVYRAKTDN